jgi:hypothetical protein
MIRCASTDSYHFVPVTDGIVEAQDSNQRLLGFARPADLVKKNYSAADMATTAQDFGQEDDVSIITVSRNAGPELAPAA